MEWNGTLKTFVPRPQPSLNFLYNYNYDQYPGMEMKHPGFINPRASTHGGPVSATINQEKKKPLTSDQLDSLERSFQEEIKLDPDRKMKLSRELGLQPRQIAVWFQNRRARWKAKQLERLYDTLKHDYDVVSREKQKLQDEVTKLKGMLRNQVVSSGYTEISGDETVESTSIRSGNNQPTVMADPNHPVGECSYVFNVEEYNNPVSSSYWGLQLPSYP